MRSPVLLLLACVCAAPASGAEGPGAPAGQDPPPPPAPRSAAEQAIPGLSAGDTAYVRASSLYLRAEPGGALLGRLAINSPLSLLALEGDAARVETGNGRVGWVALAYLSPERLTAAAALERAEAEADPAARLSWLQRAAAIAPNDLDVLRLLADGYRDAGDEAAALRVEERLAWPPMIHPTPVYDREAIWVELSLSSLGLYDIGAVDGERLTRQQISRFGLRDAGEWWVLPDAGPAVRAEVSHHEFRWLNECDASVAVWTRLEAALPEGRVPIAATRAAPPDSWSDPTLPAAPRADAEAEMWALAAERGAPTDGARLALAPEGEAWRARLTWSLPGASADLWIENPGWQIDARLGADGLEILSAGAQDLSFRPYPVSLRDVSGDGRREIVQDDGCAGAIVSADGELLAITDGRCCGC